MYLSELEIVGFKSFAQKTKLKFAQGLSAVVGPNGCGKTNVVDAIRWVLGEKKASTLRSDVMENVIFNGTKDRKPLSMAEVSITFDNTKKVLPSDYNEIVVTRRLYRNGESEYLLNKAHCRLKDILDLFMDTGIGSDSYSVIELKMVDAILSGKVDDRRAMFEEAAGIKKYKARRKESLKKLDNVRQDMERIQDILQEVRKNVNSLSRQAAKTKRYNQYLSELKTLETELYAREYIHFHNIKVNLEKSRENIEKSIINYEINLSDRQNDITRKKENLRNIEAEYNTLIEKEKKLISDIADIKRQIAVNSEKIISFDKTKERISSEIGESKRVQQLLEAESGKLKSDYESGISELSSIRAKLLELKQDRDNSLTLANEQERNVNNLRNEIIQLKNRIDSINNLLLRSKDKKSNIERKIQILAEDKLKLMKQQEDLEDDKRSVDKQYPLLREELSEAEKKLNTELEKKASLENEIEKLKLKISELKNLSGSKKASLDFLNSLVDNSESVKFLSGNNNWYGSSEKLILGEAIGTDDEYRIAILAALSDKAHSFVVDSHDNALDGINLLRSASKGKSGFVTSKQFRKFDPPGDLPEIDGVHGWLTELIRVDDNIRNMLRGVLGKTLIVSNTDVAMNLIKTSQADGCVTLDGIFVDKNGFVFGGSVSKQEGQWVGKKEKIIKLKEEIENLGKEIDTTEKMLSELSLELQSIDINSIRREIGNLELRIQENRKLADQMDIKSESISTNISMIEENTDRLHDEINEIQSDDSGMNDEISSINETLATKNNSLNQLVRQLEEMRGQYNAKQEIFRNAEIDVINSENNIKSMKSDLDRTSSELNRIIEKIHRMSKESEDFDGQKDAILDSLESDNLKLENLNGELENVKAERETKSVNKQNLSEKLELFESEYEQLQKEFEKVKDGLHQVQIQETEVNSNINNITERVIEQYNVEIQTIQVDENPDYDIKISRNQIHEIKEKLSQLGNVNFMALEEYEIQNERLEFYEKQMNDLTEAEKTLLETIEEINSTAEKNFRNTFDSIRNNFIMLFKKLFGPDGECDLHLESDDLLESDIVITAKPPNKRPHSIEMLSGGEKTLTAIALLFAIYLVKPSPFCILDEVDAPLDDANIDKFVSLIKDFSIDTQFLIVSHNKKTMESAETLYGVTMQEDGVSKVVAVRLDNSAA